MPIGEPAGWCLSDTDPRSPSAGRINAKNEPDVSVQRRVIFSAGA